VRIARLDFVTPSITMVSLPRDLWVAIPGIRETSGYTHGKLNQAYFWGSPGMGYYRGTAAGPGLLAETLYHNYGIEVDHYAALNMAAFELMIDHIGGVEVDLPYTVDGSDPPWGGPGLGVFPAGKHSLNGEASLRLARIRWPRGDFHRQDNQSLVIQAIGKKLLSPSVFPRIPAMAATFRDLTLTDLSPEEAGRMACLLNAVGASELSISQLPAEVFSLGREYSASLRGSTSVVRADPDVLADYLERFAAGEWP
jgi:polyisoprenyl-teichoic acid--peptidoglycan teichoic acid transferase